jgi:hypothetical protein
MEKAMANKTLEQVQETHSEMLATANDMGLEVPEELRDTFTDAKAGVAICKALDKIIKEKVAESEVKADTEEAAEEAVVPTEEAKETKVKKAKAVKTPKSAVLNPAKKKAASAAKALKAKGKSAVKKAVKAKVTNGSGKKRPGLEADAKVVWAKDKEIPGREGSARWKRIAHVQKSSGKTVAECLKANVARSGTLRWCIANGFAKVS